ncbi:MULTISPECIES: excalibur calcium-binding domain-containing protein [unclassified Brevundimonas]|uniref:excalibur calcium-binding domain-containing protein n=1 Tax=unclassified Brevundimonas TaxID=2622653 RepID=UPI0025BB5BC3|nr:MULTISPECIES: excalibur calcium-binding domain-containing protein [unclassified Brevundimonas]
MTSINGELDLMPVRRAPAVRTGQRMFYSCKAARAAGYENIPIGHPAYHPDMDGDGDGLACEPPPPEGRRR